MIKIEDVKINLVSYGPLSRIGGREFGPDAIIALEGIGTFKGVTIEDRLGEILAKGRDLGEESAKVHRESTRRGHASITTSLILQFEVPKCSRASTLVLAAAPFGSYLQESQRRRMVGEDEFIVPPAMEGSGILAERYRGAVGLAWSTYKALVERGVPMEDARYVLPLSSRTSIFVTGSLENFVWLMYSSRERDGRYLPKELKRIGALIEREASRISPQITSARLSFRPLSFSYPYPDPYKPGDSVVEKIIETCGEPGQPVLLSLVFPEFLEDRLAEALGSVDSARSLNPMVFAVFLEPLSLAAYHQSIRHRTVPTSVESIYVALRRALRDPGRNVVCPPSVARSEEASRIFHDSVSSLLDEYSRLLEEGVDPSDAVYLCPQAVKIYTVRAYNAFNLLWPQGFVSTRTCSYAQWEERAIAYAVWRRVEEASPVLGGLMGEKCRHLGYCPEKRWCPIIKKYRPEYGDEVHAKALES